MQIIPIKDLRDTNKISELCNSTNDPIYITKNGYGDMVIMSMNAYEKLLAQIEMYNDIMIGKEQADKGELLDGPAVMSELKRKYASK